MTLWALLLAFPLHLLAQPNYRSARYSISDTLLVGAEINYPPYCVLNAHGKADGFSIELLKAVADASGYIWFSKAEYGLT
ncbi:transporter substrate-binding domain-containing protein [Geofilum rubicundum]|nr:transporter substrate-binding domain-containing protein [Geofilum rubicundum]